jgi:hypothetical protein
MHFENMLFKNVVKNLVKYVKKMWLLEIVVRKHDFALKMGVLERNTNFKCTFHPNFKITKSNTNFFALSFKISSFPHEMARLNRIVTFSSS